MKTSQGIIPVLRILDIAKATEFYMDWLGFSIDWEHQFQDNFPLYLQISKGNITIHLTEHFGDCLPGAKIFIPLADVNDYCRELKEKDYRYYKPAVHLASWNSWCIDLLDPFGNKLIFFSPAVAGV